MLQQLLLLPTTSSTNAGRQRQGLPGRYWWREGGQCFARVPSQGHGNVRVSLGNSNTRHLSTDGRRNDLLHLHGTQNADAGKADRFSIDSTRNGMSKTHGSPALISIPSWTRTSTTTADMGEPMDPGSEVAFSRRTVSMAAFLSSTWTARSSPFCWG